MLNKIKDFLKINKIISIDDYKKYGCINCNTINIPELKTEDNFGHKKITCQKCQISFHVISDSLLIPKNFVRQHPHKNDGKIFEFEDKRPENKDEDYCIYESTTDNELLFKVYSKKAAERIKNMFDNNDTFVISTIYNETDQLNIYIKVNYSDIYRALALKNEIVRNKDKISKGIVDGAVDLELNFKNKWQKCCLFRRVFELSNVEYIKSYINPYKNTSDIYNVTSMKKNRTNIIEIFETFGMYTQVNKELENNNIDLAARCILHYASNIDTNFSKQKATENQEYLNSIRKNLQKDLLNLLNTHYKYENSELMHLKINEENEFDTKNINLTDYLNRVEIQTSYEIVIKPILDKLIDEDIIRKLTVYANEISEPLTEAQNRNNFFMMYLLYGFKLQMEVELEKINYKDVYLTIEYLIERLTSPLYKTYINNLDDKNIKMELNILKAQLQVMLNTFIKRAKEEEENKEKKENMKKRKLSLSNK